MSPETEFSTLSYHILEPSLWQQQCGRWMGAEHGGKQLVRDPVTSQHKWEPTQSARRPETWHPLAAEEGGRGWHLG